MQWRLVLLSMALRLVVIVKKNQSIRVFGGMVGVGTSIVQASLFMSPLTILENDSALKYCAGSLIFGTGRRKRMRK